MTASAPAIEVDGVSKRFEATIALDDVSLSIGRAEVRALIGENGAGKSTLVKILSGLIRPDHGTVRVFGETVPFNRPKTAYSHGIQTAFQELTLIGDLTVTQNLLLPYEPIAFSQIRRRHARHLVEAHLSRLGLDAINPDSLISDLDLPTRQKVEIAKAIGRKPRVLLLDEPTSTLSAADVDWLGRLIAQLKNDGITVVFITHRIAEVRRFCASVTVLRNGQHVGSYQIDEVSDSEVVRLVIGRSLGAIYPPRVDHRKADATAPALAGEGLRAGATLRDTTFALWPGEVLGIAGLQGMGQLELFEALFGVIGLKEGKISLGGRAVTLANPSDAVNAGVGISLVPEDRKAEGLFLKLSGKDNASLPVIDRLSRFLWVDRGAEMTAVDKVFARLQVHPRALYKPASSFSGGNQQKIAIAKWLLADSKVMLMFDPTRGVDIGTKHAIYVLIRELAAQGHAILFYSTEVPELVNLCDRVLVMYRGRIVTELKGDAISEESIMTPALGGNAASHAAAGAA
ncbi:MAG: sugar ABC transporter ATP-binding protein [Alphaproteobacteria bacterium]|nr:sugar ABC transporter ATP-binding protein [Alphaproteobacteria bacterium]